MAYRRCFFIEIGGSMISFRRIAVRNDSGVSNARLNNRASRVLWETDTASIGTTAERLRSACSSPSTERSANGNLVAGSLRTGGTGWYPPLSARALGPRGNGRPSIGRRVRSKVDRIQGVTNARMIASTIRPLMRSTMSLSTFLHRRRAGYFSSPAMVSRIRVSACTFSML